MNLENQSLEKLDENKEFCQSCEQREQLLDQIHEATSNSILEILERISEEVSFHFALAAAFVTIIHLAIPSYVFGMHIFSLICWSISLFGVSVAIGVRAIKASQEEQS